MNSLTNGFVALAALLTAAIAASVSARLFIANRRLKKRFAGIVDLELEQAAVVRGVAASKKEHDEVLSKHQEEVADLHLKYSSAREVFQRLNQQISLLEENLEDISYGVYNPHFDFATSEEYRKQLDDVRAKRKSLIKDGDAASCSVKWDVGGSKKDGARMTKQYTKLLLRAFNGETEAAIARVGWNNVTKMEERIKKAFEAVNELGSTMKMSISPAYLRVCLDELRLEHEYEAKKQDELEEQREIRLRAKEEEKAQREFERAQREAEQDEMRFQKSLEKARVEVASASGNELTELNEKIALLEQRVKEAEASKQRAISMAQQTRCGYLYIISNHGSFGEEVVKIGMTRRLDPMDRVRELGDASVPFGFDVHAMVYCDDAPKLEAEIHSHFADRRVNRVNLRREFFRVPLAEVESFIVRKGLKSKLNALAEAKEYRETIALLKSLEVTSSSSKTQSQFPDSLFDEAEAKQSKTSLQ